MGVGVDEDALGAGGCEDAEGAGAERAACCIHTSRALWSTGQLSAAVDCVLGIDGCDGGKGCEEAPPSAPAAARACDNHASLLLWSTGQADWSDCDILEFDISYAVDWGILRQRESRTMASRSIGFRHFSSGGNNFY